MLYLSCPYSVLRTIGKHLTTLFVVWLCLWKPAVQHKEGTCRMLYTYAVYMLPVRNSQHSRIHYILPAYCIHILYNYPQLEYTPMSLQPQQYIEYIHAHVGVSCTHTYYGV